jgi:hypothetical protein
MRIIFDRLPFTSRRRATGDGLWRVGGTGRFRLPADRAAEVPAPPGRAGRYCGGFISHYLIQVIYPPGLTCGIPIGLGLFVVLIAVAGYGGYLRQH